MMTTYFLDNVLSAVTSAGTPVFYVPAVVLLWRFDSHAALLVLWSLLITECIGAALKLLIAKERPLPRPRVGIVGRYDAGGFPSIHTARITALAVAINKLITDDWLIWFSVCTVLLVGYSRIYLRHHDWLDVLGGLFLGGVVSLSTLFLFQ